MLTMMKQSYVLSGLRGRSYVKYDETELCIEWSYGHVLC